MALELTHAITQAGVAPALEGEALQDALLRAITTRRGYCSWAGDHATWVVTLHHPEEQTFSGHTLSEGLAWCLVWLMFPELGIGPFLVRRRSLEIRPRSRSRLTPAEHISLFYSVHLQAMRLRI